MQICGCHMCIAHNGLNYSRASITRAALHEVDATHATLHSVQSPNLSATQFHALQEMAARGAMLAKVIGYTAA